MVLDGVGRNGLWWDHLCALRGLWPPDWRPDHTEPWYQHGTALVAGHPHLAEAEFRNDLRGEVIVHVPTVRAEGVASVPSRYVIPLTDFTPSDRRPPDRSMAEMMRWALRRRDG
jgi:hypothetical protein